MIVGQCDGQRVGGVGRFWPADEPQLPLHGHLHLFLAGVAIAGERALHAVGQVVVHGEARLRGGKADHAAGMPHQDGRLGELRVHEDLFDRQGSGPKRLQHLADTGVDLRQPGLEQFAPRPDGACLEQSQAAARPFHHAIAGDVQAGVEADDAVRKGGLIHGRQTSRAGQNRTARSLPCKNSMFTRRFCGFFHHRLARGFPAVPMLDSGEAAMGRFREPWPRFPRFPWRLLHGIPTQESL